jgi:hypothetical protein
MSNQQDYGNRKNRIWELCQLVKEYKSIEATSTSDMQIRQWSKSEIRVRMSNPKDCSRNRNSLAQLLQLMKEYRLIGVGDIHGMQIHQEA